MLARMNDRQLGLVQAKFLGCLDNQKRLLGKFGWKQDAKTEEEVKACCSSLVSSVKSWLDNSGALTHFDDKFAEQRDALMAGQASVLAPVLSDRQVAAAIMDVVDPLFAAAAADAASRAQVGSTCMCFIVWCGIGLRMSSSPTLCMAFVAASLRRSCPCELFMPVSPVRSNILHIIQQH